MSAFVWLDETRKEALRWAVELVGDCRAASALQDMLDEAKKSEEFKIQDMFTIKEV